MTDILSKIFETDEQINNLIEKWYDSFLSSESDDRKSCKLESKWYRALENDTVGEIKVPFFLKNSASSYKEKYNNLVEQRNNFEDLYLS